MHDVAPQAYGLQSLVDFVHAPAPLHAPLESVVPVQLVPQLVVVSGYEHAPAVFPSHVPPHAGSVAEHGDRDPWGGPLTAEHVPSWPLTSHA